MTTVVCDKKEMSCDQQGTTNNTKIKIKTKIFKFEKGTTPHPHGFIVGFSGVVSEWMEVCDYLCNPENYKKPPPMRNSTALVLDERGRIFYFTEANKWLQIEEPYYAIGSGSQFAMGAMASNPDTKAAVRTAMKHDIGTGYGVKTLSFK